MYVNLLAKWSCSFGFLTDDACMISSFKITQLSFFLSGGLTFDICVASDQSDIVCT